jgi:SAM-dependent methyltransferase
MDARYWDKIANTYDQEVTDAYTWGRGRTVKNIIDQVASQSIDVTDYGCGVGKLLPYLSQCFGTVYGFDFSNDSLEIARTRCRNYPNVQIAQVDLTNPTSELPKTDIAISLNVAIMPDAEKRNVILQVITSSIRPGGTLILVIPSVESILYTINRETEWHARKGLSQKDAVSTTDLSYLTNLKSVAQGLFSRGGSLTKHYLKEELVVLVKNLGLDLQSIEKVEYSWTTEYEKVPRWMRDPYPWDWLVVAQKPKSNS